MNPLIKFLEDHHEALGTAGVIAFFAFGATIPEELPYKPQALWAWFRAFILEFMSLRSGKLVSSPAPKPAVEIPAPIEAVKPQL